MSTTRHCVRRVVSAIGVTAALALTTLPAASWAAAPAAPTGLAPVDGDSTVQYKNLELGWSKVTGATSYEIQVSHDGRFGTGTVTGTSTLARWTPPVGLPRGDYLWRVRALIGSTKSSWSAEGQFTRGWSAAPTGAQTHDGTGPVPAVSWNPLPDASFYEVEFSRVPFTTGDSGYDGTREHYTCYTVNTWLQPYGVVASTKPQNPPGAEDGCAFDVTSDPADAPPALSGKFHVGETYYWRVRGRDGTVDPRTTDVPEPALACTGVWSESGYDTGNGMPIGGEPPEYTATPECSAWRNGGSFTVDATVDPAGPDEVPANTRVEPTAGDPTAATVAVTNTPMFRWDAVPGAIKYRVYVSPDRTFSTIHHVWETFGTSLLPLGPLPETRTRMYWAVQACSADAYCWARSEAKAYTKTSTVTTDAQASSVKPDQVVLKWAAQLGGTPAAGQLAPPALQGKAYQLQVSTDPVFDRVLVDRTVDRIADHGTTTASRYAHQIRGLADGLYHWRVRPVDEAEQDLGWGTPGTFRIDRAAPTVVLGAKGGFGLTAAVPLRFSEPVTGVSTSTLGVKVAGTGKIVAGRLVKVNASTWRFAPNRPWVAGQRYEAWVSRGVQDLAGKPASARRVVVRASRLVDSTSPALVKRRGDYGWAAGTASDARGGSYVRSGDRPSTPARSKAATAVRGTGVTLFACRSPRSGRVAVVLDGRRVATVDLYQPWSSCGKVWASGRLADTLHAVRVVATGTKRPASAGYGLSVDAIRVS